MRNLGEEGMNMYVYYVFRPRAVLAVIAIQKVELTLHQRQSKFGVCVWWGVCVCVCC
jgi:hypothetical protein